MRIEVKLFAVLREQAGASAVTLDVPAGGDVSAAVARLVDAYPQLARWVGRAAFAVNQTYVKGDEKLKEGDELAIIPPVSGGAS